jgi:hypothetical protein
VIDNALPYDGTFVRAFKPLLEIYATGRPNGRLFRQSRQVGGGQLFHGLFTSVANPGAAEEDDHPAGNRRHIVYSSFSTHPGTKPRCG